MQSRSRLVLLAAVLGVSVVSPSLARVGTLHPFIGPGDNPDASIGYRNPAEPLGGNRFVNDVGTAIGQTDLYISQSYYAKRSFRFGNGVSTPLATPSNDSVWVHAINNAGTVAGSLELFSGSTDVGRRAVRYASGSATATVLGTQIRSTDGSGYAEAQDISPNGTIVGNSDIYNTAGVFLGGRGARWDPTATNPVILQPLTVDSAGKGVSSADFINASGMIAGQSSFEPGTVDYGFRAVRYAPGSTTPVELTAPTADANGRRDASVYGLNDAGITIGSVRQYTSTGVALGFRPGKWNADSITFTPLGTLGSNASGYIDNSYASAINKNGVIAGSVMKYDSAGNKIGMRPVGWASGNLTAANELGILGVANTSLPTYANAINDSVTIVGTSQIPILNMPTNYAVAWFKGSTTVTNLTSLLEPNSQIALQTADAVSNTGWVSGLALYHDTSTDSYYQRFYTLLVPQAGTYGNGDANFDEAINFNDLVILAQHYNQSNAAKAVTVGDFNLDGTVDFNDLVTLAQHYNTGTPVQLASEFGSTFAADWALAQSLVPEPTVLFALFPAMALGRRRKR